MEIIEKVREAQKQEPKEIIEVKRQKIDCTTPKENAKDKGIKNFFKTGASIPKISPAKSGKENKKKDG